MMLRRRLRVLAPALAVLACANRPAATTDDSATGTSDASTGTSSTDPTGSTGTDPPPVVCDPCDDPWTLDGGLEISPGTDLSQYTCLVGVSGDLRIAGDFSAADLAPLCHLREVNGWMSIHDNTRLTDLSPFARLEKAVALQLHTLPALTTVSGLTSLREVLELSIGETGATALGSFAPDFAGIGTLEIHDNPALTDLREMNAWGFADVAFGQIVTLRNNPAIVDLTDLTDLLTTAPESLTFELVDMSGLTSLAGLGGASRGSYELAGLPLITDLKPLSKVTTLDGLRLSNIPLTDLEGLNSLQSADLKVREMPLLTSLHGLESFQTGVLTLTDLPLLESLAPLGAFTQSDAIVLYNLPLVTSLAGLDNLQSVDSLMIGDCVNESRSGMDGLSDLQGLGALTSVSELMVTNSPQLQSLAGADKLTGVDARLAIINNPALPQAAFDAFLAQVTAPEMTCFGDWGLCDCISFNPG